VVLPNNLRAFLQKRLGTRGLPRLGRVRARAVRLGPPLLGQAEGVGFPFLEFNLGSNLIPKLNFDVLYHLV
jgi:hypothetical protein